MARVARAKKRTRVVILGAIGAMTIGPAGSGRHLLTPHGEHGRQQLSGRRSRTEMVRVRTALARVHDQPDHLSLSDFFSHQ